MRESRFMEHEERKDKDVISLRDKEWSLLSKKEDTNMGNEAWSKIQQIHMAIWSSKCDSNIYSNFEVKYGALPMANFGLVIYLFEAQEVKSPMLQIVHESELKRGSYVCFKWIG